MWEGLNKPGVGLGRIDCSMFTNCRHFGRKKDTKIIGKPIQPSYIKADVNPLRKHAYSNIMKILPPKNENFQIKNSDIFHISAQNIDCGYSLEPPRVGGSDEYPQSMF